MSSPRRWQFGLSALVGLVAAAALLLAIYRVDLGLGFLATLLVAGIAMLARLFASRGTSDLTIIVVLLALVLGIPFLAWIVLSFVWSLPLGNVSGV